MNKLQEKQSIDTSDESQKIIHEAENIINQANTQFKRKKIILFCVLPVFTFILLGLFFSTIFALINTNNTKIIKGVSIYNIDVSNLSKDEAKAKINDSLSGKLSNELTLRHNDFSTTIMPSSFNVTFDVDETIEEAYSIGRNSDIFSNNFCILHTLIKPYNMSPTIYYDENLLNNIINEFANTLPDLVKEPSYHINDNDVTITKGHDGVLVDNKNLVNTILDSLRLPNSSSTIDIPVLQVVANKIDIESLYRAIYKTPVDASFTTNPLVIHPSETGVDFAISIDEAKKIVAIDQEEYIIPTKILYPSITTNDIGLEAFPDLLSEFTTSFTTSNYSRSTNIILAAEHINGTVLMPGDVFSFNDVVGQRTKAAGFKEAPAYFGGKVVQEYGGGICQVSSTLYNAALYSNLEIIDRSNHSFTPSYVKAGLDATVSWGGPEFKFSNNRNYPIKIVCDTSGKHVNIKIYGLKTENDYTVKLETRYLSRTEYQKDSNLAPGEEKVISNGSNGCKTSTYKILYDSSGNEVSRECISKDTYIPHNRVVAVAP